jgi:hypothetical protein
MLRFVQVGNQLPASFPYDANDNFQPGMIGQLKLVGNDICCGTSDGSNPIGIIDDYATHAFSAPAIDEVVIAPVYAITIENNIPVAASDVNWPLQNPNVIPYSFVTSPVDVALTPRNGMITFPAGTPLNFDSNGDGIPDSIRTVVSYSYQIPNIMGENTCIASGKITIWFGRAIMQTDQYETNQRYPLNAVLFCSHRGLLTTQQEDPSHPGIAIVTGPPSALLGTMEFLLL